MEEEGGPSFDSTPSWVIGAVVFVIVTISLAIDKLLSKLGDVLKKKNKTPLYEALLKIKEELMLMGFVSLLLAFVQDKVTHWCIPEVYADDWLPCHATKTTNSLLQISVLSSRRRLLGEEGESFSCKEGQVPFIALAVLHDLHFLIFILAVVHVISCTITVLLGEAKIMQWWKWEEFVIYKAQQAAQDQAQHSNMGEEINDIKSFPFIGERYKGVDARKRNYVYSFLKHLCGVVTKADYQAMRLGFILTHRNGDQTFNFHTYMVYAFEADIKSVVSIRWFLWLFAVISLTLNVAGWNIYFWVSFIPILFLLTVGTKLELVITNLATRFAQKHTVVIGAMKIEPSDEFFWFQNPRIVLRLIHVILFMNSFGFAIFFWTLFKFGFNSCIMGEPIYAIARLVIMVLVQTICSYSTLPLYAIVTQMGSSYNKEAMLSYNNASIHDDRVPAHSGVESSAERTDV